MIMPPCYKWITVRMCTQLRPTVGNYFDGINFQGFNGRELLPEHGQLITIH